MQAPQRQNKGKSSKAILGNITVDGASLLLVDIGNPACNKGLEG
jgi:hypothetical protein